MTDRYTKAVLTVIAAALLLIVVQNAVRLTNASIGPQQVEICDHFGRCLAFESITQTIASLPNAPLTTLALPVAQVSSK